MKIGEKNLAFIVITLLLAGIFALAINIFDIVPKEKISLSPTGIISTSYIYAGSLIASSSSDNPGKTDYYIQDHLGSNRKIIDGVLEEQSNDFYAFGEDKETSGDSDNNYKYTGKEKDDDTGLYYYGARYYNPEIGRFIQADSLRGSLADPLSLNGYVYVRNNPLKFIDPTGNAEQPADATYVSVVPQDYSRKSSTIQENPNGILIERGLYAGYSLDLIYADLPGPSQATTNTFLADPSEMLLAFTGTKVGGTVLNKVLNKILAYGSKRVIKTGTTKVGSIGKDTMVSQIREDTYLTFSKTVDTPSGPYKVSYDFSQKGSKLEMTVYEIQQGSTKLGTMNGEYGGQIIKTLQSEFKQAASETGFSQAKITAHEVMNNKLRTHLLNTGWTRIKPGVRKDIHHFEKKFDLQN